MVAVDAVRRVQFASLTPSRPPHEVRTAADVTMDQIGVVGMDNDLPEQEELGVVAFWGLG